MTNPDPQHTRIEHPRAQFWTVANYFTSNGKRYARLVHRTGRFLPSTWRWRHEAAPFSLQG